MTPTKTTKTKTATKDDTKKVVAKKAKPLEDEVVVVAEPVDSEESQELELSESDPLGDATAIPGKEKYFEAIGRRKSAVARVRLFTKKSSDEEPAEGKALITILSRLHNRDPKAYDEYFKDIQLQDIVDSPLKKLKSMTRFKATILVNGGGISGQAEAIRHGLSRALVLFDENFAKKLKKATFLTRDSRRVERKKPGRKKARKGPRWAKR